MRKLLIIIFTMALMTASALGQSSSAPTLRIVTEDPNLPSELYYGDIKVRPLRLRPGTNQPITIDDSDFFVQQHYIDFLNRFPEPDGFNYWVNILNGCGTDAQCQNRVRVEISSRFFIELEFQETGYYVMRFYKASFGRAPSYQEFIADRRLVQQTLTSQKQFAASWVQRPAFLAQYPTTLTATQFVNKLYNAAGVADAAARSRAITGLQSGKTRGETVRELAELAEFKAREYNPAFVRMQYFGYLRRDAEPAGEAYWMDVITNKSPNNYQSMICAFVNSKEYQLRFNDTRGKFNELNCNW